MAMTPENEFDAAMATLIRLAESLGLEFEREHLMALLEARAAHQSPRR
jgi:hypothetical protein